MAVLQAAFVAAVAVAQPLMAHAQGTEPAAARSVDFDLPAQPVAQALQAWSAATGITVTVPSGLRQSSTAVKGSMSGMDALRQLLEGTGLTARAAGTGMVVEEAPQSGEARVLDSVRVAGLTAGAGGNAVGVNGSTDITATEGSGSYTAVAVRLGGKAPQEIKDVPQTVSVLTAEQMRDQKITDLTSAMTQVPGITVLNLGGAQPAFYSRGWAIEQVQIDGGAPVNIGRGTVTTDTAPSQQSMRGLLDMALYDHVEVLRGADGLYNGTGNPGGVINLERKRPLNRQQIIGEAQVGSWNDRRVMVDATAPLGMDGRLRGRTVLSTQDKDQFYKNGMERHNTLYGIVEADVAQGTTLSGGASFSRWNTRAFYNGFPLLGNGDSLGRPVDDSFVFPWASDKTRSNEIFARVEQKLGDDWTATFNLTQVRQSTDSISGGVSGTFYADTASGTVWGASKSISRSKQNTADLSVLGGFKLFGLRQEVVAGANYIGWIGDGGRYFNSSQGTQPFNALTDDVDTLPQPDFSPTSTITLNRTVQTGAYLNGRFTFWEPLHVVVGARYNEYGYQFQQVLVNTGPTNKTERHQSHTALPAKVAAIYDLTKTSSVYFSKSEVYADQSQALAEDGSTLDPITGTNKELGLKWASADGRQTASISAYYTKQYGRALKLPFGRFGAWASTFGILPDGRICCFVTTDAPYISKGIDVSYGGEVVRGLDLNVAFSRNDATQVPIVAAWQNQPRTPLESRAPKGNLRLAGRYRFPVESPLSGLTLGLSAVAQGATTQQGVTCPGTTNVFPYGTFCSVNTQTYTFHQGGYTIWSGLLRYAFSDKTNLDLNIGNLTDKHYYQTIGNTSGGNFYGAPRSFTLALRSEF